MKRKHPLAAIFAIALFSASAVAAPADAAPAGTVTVAANAAAVSWVDATSANAKLASVVAKYHIPGLAVAIVDRTGTAYSSGFSEAANGVPVTADTPFYLGSTSKTITALAALDLVRAGAVSLDDPISKYLPELPAWANAITVRHLLNHTSGLTGRGMDRVARGETSFDEEVRALSRCVPQSESGTAYAYFNGNYRLLGAMIERVSGVSFGEYVSRSVFAPLGMTRSSADGDPRSGVSASGVARGHGMLFGLPLPREQEVRAGALPSGYIVSSASDFARLLTDELRSVSGEPCVLDRSSVEASWSPPVGKCYAMGWISADESMGGPFLFHGGSLENYQSFVMLDPSTGRGFVMMMSQGGFLATVGGFSAVRNVLLSIVRGVPSAPDPSLVPAWVVTALVVALIALELFLSVRVRRGTLKALGKGTAATVASLALEALPVLAIVLLVPVANGITGDPGDWKFLSSYLPESALLALVIVITGAFRIAYKVFYYYIRSFS